MEIVTILHKCVSADVFNSLCINFYARDTRSLMLCSNKRYSVISEETLTTSTAAWGPWQV